MPSSRRTFLASSVALAGFGLAKLSLPVPAWARAALLPAGPPQDAWDLSIGKTPVVFGDRRALATGVNGTLPGPLVRLKEGQRVVLNVANALDEDSSIHWHGLLVPTGMDGVPGLSFPGIRPGERFRYEFDVRQNGTYWYHSHSGLQEQTGVYGPLIIDPAEPDPVAYDREYVVLLSDWTFEDPYRLLNNLKIMDDYYNLNRKAGQGRLFGAWDEMRMSKSDIADVSAKTYTFLMNGQDALSNWTAEFLPGERVRLRIINGSAMSFFNVRIPGVPMTVVQSDGQYVQPVETDELQIGTAETYDVVVRPEAGAWTLMAESMDRTGFVRGTLTSDRRLKAAVPPLREMPELTMKDMGMDHGRMAHGDGHKGHSMPVSRAPKVEHEHRRGPGVANIAESPTSRLDEPGIGLESVPHRALRYSELKSLEPNADPREPSRTLELHLTGNMHRYMWSFDGIKYSEVKGPIELEYGERLRLVLVNDTMMSHPIHLHGMFFELVNGHGAYGPRKNTLNIKPAERVELLLTANEPGLWAFHCHLLYHMKAGMMRAVRVSEPPANA